MTNNSNILDFSKESFDESDTDLRRIIMAKMKVYGKWVVGQLILVNMEAVINHMGSFRVFFMNAMSTNTCYIFTRI